MNTTAIDTVLRSLQRYDWGWRTRLPDIRFIGQPVELRVDTQPMPIGDPSPPLDGTETELVHRILGGLAGVLAEVERHYREYNNDVPDVIERVHEPHIWLSRDVLAEDGPCRWAFVVGIADAPDWCIHSEFVGLEFQEIWAGD